MKIVISPTKNMKMDLGKKPASTPFFLQEADCLLSYLKTLTIPELKEIYKASDSIVETAAYFIQEADLSNRLTPAIFMYDGIQFAYMEPNKLDEESLSFLQGHLFILSGLYGALSPLDGITRYRLEMGSKIDLLGEKTLYGFWKDKIAKRVYASKEKVLNIASEEYAKSIRKYIPKEDFIDVLFYEEDGGKLKEKGVYAKMARGRMVKYLAKNKIDSIEDVYAFSDLGYHYDANISLPNKLIFVRR